VATTDMGLKEGEGVLCPFRGALGTRLGPNTMWPAPMSTSVPSGKWRLHPSSRLANSVGCHSPHRNISTNYYLVVEMHTVTVRSDDARYVLN